MQTPVLEVYPSPALAHLPSSLLFLILQSPTPRSSRPSFPIPIHLCVTIWPVAIQPTATPNAFAVPTPHPESSFLNFGHHHIRSLRLPLNGN